MNCGGRDRCQETNEEAVVTQLQGACVYVCVMGGRGGRPKAVEMEKNGSGMFWRLS